MTAENLPANQRRLRLGMVGGGPGGLSARCIASPRAWMIAMNWWRRRLLPIAARNRTAAEELHIPRAYANFAGNGDGGKSNDAIGSTPWPS